MNLHKKCFLVVLASLSLTLAACNNGGGDSSNSSTEPTSTEPAPTTTTTTTTTTVPTNPTVSSISIKTGTELKVQYNIGDEFSVEHGIVVVKMSDNTRKEIPLTLAMISNVPNMNEVHENYDVIVTYEGKTTSYTINVIDPDQRTVATIGVSYKYNGGNAVEIEDDTQVLSFTVGKDYSFHYGAYPNEAYDSVGFKYFTRDEEHTNLGTTKPTEIGEYEYRVYISETDEVYRPVERVIKFDIVEIHTDDILINYSNKPTLSETPVNTTQDIKGLTFNYKNVKDFVAGAFALVKTCNIGDAAGADDNYVEIASPTAFTSPIRAEFIGTNSYLRVFASYDGEHFVQVDTLSAGKQLTDKAKDYFFVRLVGSPIGSDTIEIYNLSFSFEVDGAPADLRARAENSDLLNTATSDENNAYFHFMEDVGEQYDPELSSKGLGLRLNECDVKIDFGVSLSMIELQNFVVTMKAKTTEDATFQATNKDETVKNYVGLYARPFDEEGVRLGFHKKLMDIQTSDSHEWYDITLDLSECFDNFVSGTSGIYLHLYHKCTTGWVIFDDIRLVQKDTYPALNALDHITVSGATDVFDRGAIFLFDATVTAYYTNETNQVIMNNDDNLEVIAPSLASSGKKEVVVKYTEGGITKSASYYITVIGTNPKEEETQPIVAEADDIAKAENQIRSTSSYDDGTITNNTEFVYGNSTNSIKITGIFRGADTGRHVSLRFPSKISANTVHLKFFAKLLPYELHIELMNEAQTKNLIPLLTTNALSTNKTPLVATDAGNGWTMYEKDVDISAATATGGLYLMKFKCAGETKNGDDLFYIDGIELSVVS